MLPVAVLTSIAVAVAPVGFNAAGPSEQTRACLAAHESAQLSQQSTDLLSARAQARVCGADHCPALVREDCVAWLARIDARLSSVSLSVTLDGGPVDPDRLLIDGEPVQLEALSEPVELNPGSHMFVAEMTVDGKLLSAEASLTVEGGSRGQPVRLELRTPPNPGGDAMGGFADSGAGPNSATQTVDTGRKLRIAGYTVLGVAGAAAIGWGVAGGLGLQAGQQAEDDCAPFCSSSRVDEVRVPLVTADVLAGATAGLAVVGAVLVAIGIRRKKTPATAVAVMPTRRGAGLSFGWQL